MKKISTVLVSTILMSTFYVSTVLFANEAVVIDGYLMCKLSNGEYAKDTWCWVDTNNNSIAECYRFNSSGQVERNYKSEDGRETNDKGQLIENGFVIEKLLSNGKVRYDEGMPFVDVKSITKYTKYQIYETPEIETIDNNGMIVTNKMDIKGPVIEEVGGEDVNTDSSKQNFIITNLDTDSNLTSISQNVVAGKNLEKFIIAKNHCKSDIDEVLIYDGKTIWDDCIELRGTGASVKFNLKDNNHIYFEVAEAAHRKDEEDINIRLEMFVDGKLYETIYDFVESDYQVISEELEDVNKVVELKLNSDINTIRKIYVHNGKVKKVKANN